MRKTSSISAKGSASTATLDRLLGEEARIMHRESLIINQFVEAELLRISITDPARFPEEGGRLYLYPIADGCYHLHLLYRMPEGNMLQPEFYWLRFLPDFFNMFDQSIIQYNTPFRFDQTTEQQFPLCNQTRMLLQRMRENASVTQLIHALHMSELALQLLRRAIEHVTVPFNPCPVPACRFLANESEREKIMEARRIMEESIDQPFTIKELSRKVAMNECYLKKGFKTLTGKTINEYQQELRIAKARELLRQEGQTVSDVASMLGYSSISHFSTAFKKATGIKPCELLG